MTTYRTTDLAKWGAGIGMRLSASQVDVNFWDINVRLDALEALPPPGASIDDFTITGRSLYLHLTDSTVLGPQTLPIATYHSRRAWAPSTSYSVLDTVTANGGLYEVLVAHTSDLTFDAAANDGMGHDLYNEIFLIPGNALPSGGAEGQILIKSASTSYAVTWSWRYPGSGLAGMVPIQQSSTQDDVAWGYQQAENVEFTASSDSSLSSDNVADALEELEALIASTAAGLSFDALDISYTPSSDSELTSDNVADALDELGALIAGGGGGGGSVDFSDLTGSPSVEQTRNSTFPNISGTAGSHTVDVSTSNAFEITPGGDLTLNATNPDRCAEITIIIYTSGTTSRTVTFGTNFRSQGTLATGTVDAKVFVVKFIGDGFYMNEISRTTAM